MILLNLFLWTLGALAAPPELVCDPDLRVKFEVRLLGASSAVLSGEENRAVALTGREPDGPAPGFPETGPSTFYAFGQPASLYVQRELLRGGDDGVVVSRAGDRVRVYHCRAR